MTGFISYSLAREVAERVYDFRFSLPLGWELDTSFNPNAVNLNTGMPGEVRLANGLYAYALKKIVDDGTRILAFRGTEGTEDGIPDLRDWYNNLNSVGADQFRDPSAISAINQWLAQNLVAGRSIELVGHSLGGALVQWAINNTNLMTINAGDNFVSVTEAARAIPGNDSFQVDPSQLHFYTFNAPGITNSPSATQASDKTSIVTNGEHHVIAGFAPFVHGDAVHLLTGAPVGGQVYGHYVNFEASGEYGFNTHSIKRADWWNTFADSGYDPFYLGAATSQILAANLSRLGNTDGTVDSNREAIFRLTLFTVAAIGTRAAGTALGPVADALRIGSINLDATALADVMATGSDGFNRGLNYVLDQAKTNLGVDLPKFGADLLASIDEALINLFSLRAALISHAASFFEGLAKSIYNAFTDTSTNYSDASISLSEFGSFATIDAYHDAYDEAFSNASLPNEFKQTLEDARAIVEAAGQTIVIAEGRPANPFDTQGFNPDAVQIPASQLKEGQVRTFTIFLPYEAGVGGQNIKLKLEGSATSAFKVLDHADEITPVDGQFNLHIAEGRREFTFGLWAQQDVAAASALTLSATLVDSIGQPTHLTHQEATLNLNIVADAMGEIVLIRNNEPDRFASFWENGNSPAYIDGLGGNDTLSGGDERDRIYGGQGNDWLLGHDGDDQLYGSIGNDYLLGGLGADIVRAGDGDDVVISNRQFYFDTHAVQGTSISIDTPEWYDRVWRDVGSRFQIHDTGLETLPDGYLQFTFGIDFGSSPISGVSDNGFTYVYDPATSIVEYSNPDGVQARFLVGTRNVLEQDGADELIYGGAGADLLGGDTGQDFLSGEAGDDKLAGNGGNDVLWGANGQDSMLAGAGDDYVAGGDDADHIWGETGNDALYGGTGNDLIYGDSTSVHLLAQHGNDFLDGGSGDDLLLGQGGNDELFGRTGVDELQGGTGNDFLDGGEGIDRLFGQEGADTLFGGAGADELVGNEGDDFLSGEEDNDRLFGEAGADILEGDAGDDQLQGGADNDTLSGGDGADVLFGEAGNDTLSGGFGNDELQGADGNDILDGGVGNDQLHGDAGDDVYQFGSGDGQDGVDDFQGQNRIVLPVAPAQLTIGQTVQNGSQYLVLQYGANDAVFIKDGFLNAADLFSFSDSTTLAHAELLQLAPRLNINGGDSAEILTGTSLDDWIIASGGNDILKGGRGIDTLQGGSGNDVLEGGGGNDRLFGEVGDDDYLFSQSSGYDVIEDRQGVNRIRFGPDIAAGDVSAFQATGIFGEQDLYVRYGANDVIRIRNGTSQTITSYEFADGTVLSHEQMLGLINPAAQDSNVVNTTSIDDVVFSTSLQFGAGSLFTSAAGIGYDVGSYQTSLQILESLLPLGASGVRIDGNTNPGGTNTINFLNGGSGNDALQGSVGIDVIRGEDGDDQLYGESGDDILDGGAGSDRLNGGTGADNVKGDVGNDFLHGGAGDDAMFGGADHDTLDGGVGNDRLFADEGNDVLFGREGNDGLSGGSGNDYLLGGLGNDSLDGGFGSDTLEGDEGNDGLIGWEGVDRITGGPGDDNLGGEGFGFTLGVDFYTGGTFDRDYLFFALGDGQDRVWNGSTEVPDDIVFGEGIYPQSLQFNLSRSTDFRQISMAMSYGSSGDRIEFRPQDNNFDLQFADGSRSTLRDMYLQVTGGNWTVNGEGFLPGTDAVDIFISTISPTARIEAHGGDDLILGHRYLFAGDGADTILLNDAGTGSFFLQDAGSVIDAGQGNDFFGTSGTSPIFAGGRGSDEIAPGAGYPLLLFNRGDGEDRVFVYSDPTDESQTKSYSVSLSGIEFRNLSLLADPTSAQIVLEFGGGDRIIFSNRSTFYDQNDTERWVNVLQVVLANPDPSSADPLLTQQFQRFDLYDIVSRFLQMRNLDPTLVSWNFADVLSEFYLGGSNGELMGGTVAYEYARSGRLDHLSTDLLDQSIAAAPAYWGPQSLLNALQLITPINDIATAEDQSFAFAIPANTFSSNAASINASPADGSPLPRWLSFDPSTRSLSGIPGNSDVGALAIRVTATDSTGRSAFDEFNLTVTNVNDSPTLGMPVANQNVAEDSQFVFFLPATTFADVDVGDTLNYEVSRADGSPLPSWLSFTPATQTLSGTPGNDDVGSLALKVTASDVAGASASDTFHLTVVNVNDPPTLAAQIADQTVEEESAFNFIVPATTFADTDTVDSFTFSASLGDGSTLPLWLNFDATTRTFDGTPKRQDLGMLNIRVTATDSGGLAVSDVFELMVTQAPSQMLVGTAAGDVLTGRAGDDLLDGGAGADTLKGKSGNDSYVVDNISDLVLENPNEGTDTVLSSVSNTLSANVENLTLTGTARISGTGNDLNNILTGNSAANALAAGGGDDTYFIGAGDTVVENANEGTDTVNSSAAYTLAANLENLTLTGGASIAGTGNDLVNVINGNTGDNLLNGGVGADSMSGGAGDDAYLVDNVGDIVFEYSNEGTDSVLSSVSYALSGNVENLILTGSAPINGTGNAIDNVLTGNFGANILKGEAGNDVLAGAGGTDTLIGGPGDDNYVAIDSSSTLIENLNEGTDTVRSFVTHSLSANFENLTLLGSAAVNGTGNNLNNVFTGNSAKNALSGKAGHDIYIIGGTDVVSEVANEGIDLVKIGSTYTLGANVEALNLTGTSAINGTGNTLNNLLVGNSAVNTLHGSSGNDLLLGLAGNDTLTDRAGNQLFDGGAGADTLTGGTGNELFIGGVGNDTITTGTGADMIGFNRGDGTDTVNASTGADNTISLGGGINYSDLSFSKSGNNLILNTASAESITFKDWYASTANRSVVTLQMVAEAMSDFDAAGSDPLKDDKIQTFDFDGLVDRFDQSGVVSNWSLSNALLDFHLSGSDTEALGGDLAYHYGKNNSLTGIGYGAAQGVVGSSQFGTAPQTLQPLASLQEGVVKLA